MRHLLVATILLLVLGQAVAQGTWTLRIDGVGPLRFGLSLKEVNRLLGEKHAKPVEPDEQHCFYVTPVRHPKLGLMFVAGRLSRIDLDRGVRTDRGVQLGDPVNAIQQRYPRHLRREQHFYAPTDEVYLTYRPPRSPYALRFETDRGTISAIYSGYYQQVQYVEGCS